MLRATLLLAVLSLVLPAQDSRPPPRDDEILPAVANATTLLLDFQENYLEGKQAESSTVGPPREWPYEGVYRTAGLIPPGYRVGGTAICSWALLESPGFESDAARKSGFLRGIVFILDALEKDPLLQSGFKGTYDVRGWAHAYGLRTLLRSLERNVLDDDVAQRSEKMVRTLIKVLVETEIPENGGWNYARAGAKRPCGPSTFMTAPTLQALFQARKQGFDVPEPMLQRGLKALEDARLDTGAFQYKTSKQKIGTGFEDVPGACARMAVVETTLYLGGRGSIDRIRGAVEAFFEHWEWLEKRRKQTGTHVAPYMIAPYYFHFAHTYVAQAIEQLPEPERPTLRSKLRALYWLTREEDGGWNDRVFRRSEGYGTAMAILGLLMPDLPPPARLERKTATATKPSR